MSAHPDIGGWYRIRGGDQFEVVAVDEDDGTVEVQHSDGSVEELELGEWEAQDANGYIEAAQSPDDWHASTDFDRDRDRGDSDFARSNYFASDSQVSGGLEGLDLFDGNDSFSFR